MVDFDGGGLMVCERTVAEKSNDSDFLLRLLHKYLEEINALWSKLKDGMPKKDDDGKYIKSKMETRVLQKRHRQTERLTHLLNACVPYVVGLLQKMAVTIPQRLLSDLKNQGAAI